MAFHLHLMNAPRDHLPMAALKQRQSATISVTELELVLRFEMGDVCRLQSSLILV